MRLTRRRVLAAAAATGGVAALGSYGLALSGLQPVGVDNPLDRYPDRDWERVYREQYAYESSFTFVCSPNDTHACRLRCSVRNGVVARIEQNYDAHRYADPFGNTAGRSWDPRGCEKGLTTHRRVYGPSRLKYPLIRRGWKRWADDGFPPLDAALRTRYAFDARGTDELVRASWDDATRYLARAFVAIARTYSGAEGAARLREAGYAPEMIAAMQGAGTRTFKLRGGMGLLGVIGKYGMYRMCNSLALLDDHVRGVGPDRALGGRNWSNYTWHGDQAPGFPFVHGLQSSDVDMSDLRLSRLHIQVGKNLVENKMPESHFFHEVMERGGTVVTITPEYGPPATKSDYWIPIRPQTDAALFLGIARLLIERGQYDEAFVKAFTDLPLLVRTDTLKRLRAVDAIPGYAPRDMRSGPSMTLQGFTESDRARVGDVVAWDRRRGGVVALTRDDVGPAVGRAGLDLALDGRYRVRLVDGSGVEVAPLFELYREHLRDYGLDDVAEMTSAPKELIVRLADDIARLAPVAIHIGEGINHWFHATEADRAMYLPLMLTGNVGKPGAGCHTWAGNYKSALFQGTPATGPGFEGWIYEDPFAPQLDPAAHGRTVRVRKYARGEEPAYWNRGDSPLAVATPAAGRKVFTGSTHMPTPTKVIWATNVNLFNNAKWAYEMLKNVNPKVDCIVTQDIEMTATCEYSDVVLPANSWLESEGLEMTASCSNPFLQIWKGGIRPLYDTKDDLVIYAEVARALAAETGDRRFADHWRFAIDGKREVYMQRLLETSATTADYRLADIMAGRYGEPGAALMLFRTLPRIPFYEQIHDGIPFYTDTGRLNAYCDIPEAIEYGENFIVHREGPEATPYLPNAIVSTNPLVRPNDYGIPADAEDADLRTVRNLKRSWAELKRSANPLWTKGFRFYCLTPKTRHRVHSSWSNVDWQMIWDSNFGDPYRADKRSPDVTDHQMHINPEAARDLGIADGDYVWVDANPADRPYRGWKEGDPFYKVARLMLRAKYNPAYPYGTVMIKHAPYIATERSVRAHETRPDGLALSEGTGYRSNLRYGSQQSVTRDWSMPMHQTDSLFHKAKDSMHFVFGYEADNHAVNTVPKETLVRVTRAEPGGLEGKGAWAPGESGYAPGKPSAAMRRYLEGRLTEVRRG